MNLQSKDNFPITGNDVFVPPFPTDNNDVTLSDPYKAGINKDYFQGKQSFKLNGFLGTTVARISDLKQTYFKKRILTILIHTSHHLCSCSQQK